MKGKRVEVLAVAISLLFAIVGCAVNPKMQPEEGWEVTRTINNFTLVSEEKVLLLVSPSEGVSVQTVQLERVPGNRYRPVIFTREGQRIEVPFAGSLSLESGDIAAFSLSKKDLPQGLAMLAIETQTPEARRRLAWVAYKSASKNGMFVLPPPVESDTYTFKLQADDSVPLSSDLLRGKIVIIDTWATWCAPCMALMPTLVELAEKYPNELVVVSINVGDETEAHGKRKLEELFGERIERWKHYWVPPADRELWFSSLGSTAIPFVLIVDKEGLLQPEYGPISADELGKVVTTLLK